MNHHIAYECLPAPGKDCAVPVPLTDATMNERREKVLARMRAAGLDKLVVYEDVEHSGNFAYLVGYYTRFEEALMILDRDGEMTLVLGNENLGRARSARFPCKAVHVSLFSLPNQPNRRDKGLAQLLREAGLAEGQRIGLAGWKYFTEGPDDVGGMFDVPAYIVRAIEAIVGDAALLIPAAGIYIGPDGARRTNNANEIAHYEYGAALASDCVLDAMDRLAPGTTELELGDALQRHGQHTSVTTIAAVGERFIQGNMFPTDRRAVVGAPVSLTVSYAGGLSSRAGYAVESADQLPDGAKDYLEALAIPYFNAYVHWLEQIRIGMTGGALWQAVEDVLPRCEYHWTLCPGHLVAEEEWLCSPVYEGSEEPLRSGMIFQIDIIPGKAGMGGVTAESTVALADDALKAAIRRDYPDLWARIGRRRQYIESVLGIRLSPDVLPLCATVAYMRPLMLDKARALCVRQA